jgi:nitrate/TMAO reductase-like tetraheme cytochrome c subunit
VGWSHPAAFPLSNGHAGQACNACHASGVYHGLTNTCVSCHQTQYNATTNPNHASAGYGTNCVQCHTTVTWLNATFSHPATFPLTNGHAGQTCNACHTNGVYTGLSTACNSCHNGRYTAATNPNHVQAAFNTTCNTCHNTVAWRPSVNWTHPTTFPLTNGHANRTCNACHASGVYHGLTNTCVSCHQANYNATTNPNHASAGFGTGCVQCHNTTTWLNATFNHTPFVITTGSHRSPQTIACTRCHTTGQYSQFSCTTNCHAQTTTNQHHSQVRNYVYASANCYACHPTGRGN